MSIDPPGTAIKIVMEEHLYMDEFLAMMKNRLDPSSTLLFQPH
jgi:hypothetical protein